MLCDEGQGTERPKVCLKEVLVASTNLQPIRDMKACLGSIRFSVIISASFVHVPKCQTLDKAGAMYSFRSLLLGIRTKQTESVAPGDSVIHDLPRFLRVRPLLKITAEISKVTARISTSWVGDVTGDPF